MDESRKAFESWCKTVMTDDADFCMEWGDYSNLNVRLRWEAWTASRAAIEIELPEIEKWRFVESVRAQIAYRSRVRDEIIAAGIKVKE